MIWETWLQNAATALEMTTSQAGIFLSLLFTMGLVVAVLIATRGKQAQASIGVVALFGILIFTFMGWFPTWLGAGISLVVSLFIAAYVRGSF
jgi:hypothetical protein